MTTAEMEQLAEAIVEKAMDMEIRDIMIGSAMGKGAIPLYGRETRKEPCSCCLIDPAGPNTPKNRMCTTKGAIGLLNNREEREWCSEIKIVPDGRCTRAMAIREAAKECKEKYPEDTEAFFSCYIPAFSQITRGSNPGKVTVICPICSEEITITEYNSLSRSEALIKHLEKKHPFSQITKGGNPSTVPEIELYRTTRGFEEDAALRTDLETVQGYKLHAVFETPAAAQSAARGLTEQAIRFVKHISTTGVETWEVYAKPRTVGNPGIRKEPWQMTKDEFVSIYLERFKHMLTPRAFAEVTPEELQKEREEAIDYQKHTIKHALARGELVAPEVLADYPDLVK